MLRIGSIVWGTTDVPRSLAFWTAALDYAPLHEPDDDWALLGPRNGEGVLLALDLVTSDAPKRHHLDLYSDDQTAEVDRMLGLGATRVDWDYPDDADYVVLADPDGNTFCVVQK